MDRGLSHSLYEQLLYALLGRITGNRELVGPQKAERAKAVGESFGRKAFLIFSRQLPHNAYHSTDAVLNILATEFWRFLFENETSNVTSPAPKAISFKDNNLALLKRLDCPAEDRERRDELVAVAQHFLAGVIGGVLATFQVDYKTLVTFQNDCLFINITCE